MSTIRLADRCGNTRALDAVEGWSLMEILRAHRLPIATMCAGTCSRGTCHVLVDKAWLGRLHRPDAEEAELLNTLHNKAPNSRLSCQIIFDEFLDGLTLYLP